MKKPKLADDPTRGERSGGARRERLRRQRTRDFSPTPEFLRWKANAKYRWTHRPSDKKKKAKTKMPGWLRNLARFG